MQGLWKSCVCVCYHTMYYIPPFFTDIHVSLGLLCCFQCMHCVDFVEDALFKSNGNICWSPLPPFLDQLSMDKRNSNGFFSSRLVCRTSDSSCNSTDWSLVTVDYQPSFMACDFHCVEQNCWSGIHMHTCMVMQHITSSCAIAQLQFCGYSSRCLVNARLLC